MSKELEKDYLEVCFKRIKNLQVCVDYEKDIVKSVDEILPNSCNKVEQALFELKAIKEAYPKILYGKREQRGGLQESLDTSLLITEEEFKELLKDYDNNGYDYYCYDERCNQILFLGDYRLKYQWLYIQLPYITNKSIKEANSSESLDIQENFINCFKELLTKTDHNIIQVNITRNMAQEIVNLYEQYKNSNSSESLECSLKLYKMVESAGNGNGFNLNEAWNYHKTIEQTLLKAQEQENENARAFGKDIINLNKTLKQTIDEPILYVSRYGNKYIVPQELFENQCDVLNIIKEKDVDMYSLRRCETVEEYNTHFAIDEYQELTEEEFDLLKRYFENGRN